ncbi:MAG: calcium-binding protein [Thermoleophilaceae bacterium]
MDSRVLGTVMVLAVLAAPASAASPQVSVSCQNLPARDGSDRAETIRGSARSERIFAFGGADRVVAGKGNDCVFGGDGANTLYGGTGDDTLEGKYGIGPRGRAYADRLYGGPGDDTLDGWDGDDVIAGGAGSDHIEGWSGADVIYGGPGADAIGGGAGQNRIDGGAGDDRISSANGVAETVRCGTGRDLVRADPSDHLIGCERVTRVRRPLLPAVRPRVGGTQTTFSVSFKPPLYGSDTVQLGPRCGASASAFPWRQSTPFTPGLVALPVELPRPVGAGWCPGAYRGRIVRPAWPFDTGYPCATVAAWKAPSKVYVGPVGEDQCGRPATVIGGFRFRVVRGAHPAEPHPPCRPPGSNTLATTATARVFSLTVERETYTYGCLLGVRGLMELGGMSEFGDSDFVDLLQLAGPYAGFAYSYQGPASSYTQVHVVDLRSGAVVHVGGAGPDNGDDNGAVTDLVMKPNGSVAWIGAGLTWNAATRQNERVTIVGKIDTGGYAELDRGDDIDAGSLRLDGSALSWTNAGRPRTATLD